MTGGRCCCCDDLMVPMMGDDDNDNHNLMGYRRYVMMISTSICDVLLNDRQTGDNVRSMIMKIIRKET